MCITMAKRKAFVDINLCVACGACVKVCPLDALSIIKGIYSDVNSSKCVGCGKCVKECPASVISIISQEQ
ncbi:MAG: 4Fe-4S binding protein [Cellulosilyticaceae bacterium]